MKPAAVAQEFQNSPARNNATDKLLVPCQAMNLCQQRTSELANDVIKHVIAASALQGSMALMTSSGLLFFMSWDVLIKMRLL